MSLNKSEVYFRFNIVNVYFRPIKPLLEITQFKASAFSALSAARGWGESGLGTSGSRL